MSQEMRTETGGMEQSVTDVIQQEIIKEYMDQTQQANVHDREADWVETVTLKISEGWVGDRFISKSGQELVEVKIPNADRKDKTPWPSFVTDPKRLHANKYGTGLWMKVPKNAHTTLKRRERVGVDPSGKGIYEDRMSSIPNTELKSMTDAARRSARNESRTSENHMQQVKEMITNHQEDLPDFLQEPARAR